MLLILWLLASFTLSPGWTQTNTELRVLEVLQKLLDSWTYCRIYGEEEAEEAFRSHLQCTSSSWAFLTFQSYYQGPRSEKWHLHAVVKLWNKRWADTTTFGSVRLFMQCTHHTEFLFVWFLCCNNAAAFTCNCCGSTSVSVSFSPPSMKFWFSHKLRIG